LLIGNPDPAAKRRVVQRKSHGKANARGLTGAELAEQAMAVRERAERAALEEEEDGLQIIPNTPPKVAGESQGGTSITLAIRSTPERPCKVAPPSNPPPPLSFLPPPSTAPPILGEATGKRKRTMTDRYREGREEGLNPLIGHSQQDSTPR
jgi:hypothetical protein